MKVNLKIKEDNTVETIPFEVEELNILQVTKAIKTVKDIIDVVKEDPHLQSILSDMFDEAQKDQSEKEAGQKIIQSAVGAMDVLLTELPEKATELLSIMAGIEYDTFLQQKAEDIFDIYDAIIKVNDIEKLVKRAKKSFDLTKGQVKVMNLFQNKAPTEQKQAQ